MFRRTFCYLFSAVVVAGSLAGLALAAEMAEQVTPAGRELAARYDSFDVDHHWLPGMTVSWKTGNTLHAATDHGVHTHCSAFVAAVCTKLDVPMLCPPPQAFLANKQQDWLLADGRATGWREVHSVDAQRLANQGSVVVASFKNTTTDYHSGHGHIAMIRPASRSVASILRDGPQITQAGGHNFNSGTLAQGFHQSQPVVRFFAYFAPAK